MAKNSTGFGIRGVRRVCVALILLVSVSAVYADYYEGVPPLDTPQGALDALVFYIQKFYDGDISAEQKQQNEVTRSRISEILSLRDIAKLSLQDHWAKLNADEQERFMNLFQTLVEKIGYKDLSIYFDKIIITFFPMRMLNDGRARINTSVYETHDDLTLKVDYVFRKKDTGEWIIVDVHMDGASLVTDYRNQFNTIVRRRGIPGLFDSLQSKLDKILEEEAAEKGK